MEGFDADALLGEQQAYYRAVAPEYDEAAQRDVNELDRPELEGVLASFAPAGDVLELAGGTGQWTRSLVRSASRLTVLDGSKETLAINRHSTARSPTRVEYVVADLFGWRPPRRFDVVFFSFWLSHVPHDRFDDFWGLVDAALKPEGRVFFIDSALPRFEPEEHLRWDDPQRGISRRQVQGREYNIVKIFWEPTSLKDRLAAAGFDVTVNKTSRGYCIYGHGSRSTE